MIFIGIDNGTSGSIAILPERGDSKVVPIFIKMPVKKCLNYTKTKQWINRIDTVSLKSLLSPYNPQDIILAMERPMIFPRRFKATISAVRALEATTLVLEDLKIAYDIIDSKVWQKLLLPSGAKGEELKEASLQVGHRLFPQVDLGKFKDADGLLIAEYLRRTYGK